MSRPLICPNCKAEVFPDMYGESSFVCFNCETVVSQISLRRRINHRKEEYGEERNTGIRDLEGEVPTEERAPEEG